MKKHFIPLLLALSMCLTVLSGCVAVRGFEKDLQVVLEANGEYYGCYTVNIFNNAVVPEPEPPEGKVFVGWTAQEPGDASDEGAAPISESTGLIRYADVKDYIAGERLSVTLYAIFEDAPQRDLVIAWYAKTATSGLDQAAMDGFEAKLYEYLSAQGYNPEKMDILIRGYEGNVGDTCSAIRKDGDVDIMVGWSNSDNLTETGGFVAGEDFLENVGEVTIGEKARYAARKTDTELTLLVYAWIQDEYGIGAGAAPAPEDTAEPATEPTAEPEPAVTEEQPGETPAPADLDAMAGQSLIIAWYAKSDTSGIDQAAMDAFQTKLYDYLTAQGLKPEKMSIAFRGYDGKVGDSCAAIKSDGDVDIMMGWSNSENLTETGGFVEGQDFLENVGDVTIGEKARYIARKTETELCRLVYAWIQSEFGA